MITLRFLLVLAAIFLGSCAEVLPLLGQKPTPVSLSPEELAVEEYRLGTGDVISIRVYGEEDMRFERLRLNESPTITFPFGEMPVHGRTPKELEAAITETLKGRLLVNPRVLVNIEEYRPFFVQGQVARPGAYPYQPGLTVRRALTIGGGLRERASLSHIFIVRARDKTSTPRRVDLNTPVRPGDTLNVEESFF